MRKAERLKKGQEEKAKGGVKTREVVGILLLAFSVFSVVALYAPAAGWVGLQLRSVLRMGFGDLAIVFSAIFLFLSLWVFRGKKWPPSIQRLLGLILLVTSITLVFHMLYHRGYQFPPSFAEEINYARRGEGGGILGAILLVFSYNAFGIQGSYVLVITMTLLGLIFLFKISLIDLVRNGVKYLWGAIGRWWLEKIDGYRDWKDEGKRRRLKKQSQKKTEKEPPVETESAPIPENRPQRKRRAVKKDEESKAKPEPEKEPQSLVLNLPANVGQSVYPLPPTYLLKKSGTRGKLTEGVQSELLEETFQSFGIEAKVVNVSQGPVVTRYELQPAPGIKVSRITALADDLALALAAEDVRIEAPVPGKPVVGIEVPNKSTEAVLLRDVLESPEFAEHPSPVALALGKDIAGKPVIADLKKWLHVLVAGSTGSGKSVCLNAIIASILFRANPEVVKLLMVDPKRVELSGYDGIPHLISPVVTDPKKAAIALRWAVGEMERRYQLFADSGVRNIDMYLDSLKDVNPEEEPKEHLPYIVIIVDELADLMMVAASEVEDAICRLAQMARAAGMYLIIATQRPSVDVITGLIKANVPSRIAFAVSSQVDSRTILDMGGAERLIGKGDMLYYPIGANKPVRAQGAWISDKEVEALVEYWQKQGEPEYQENVVEGKLEISVDEGEDDELLADAIRLVVENGQASISMLQRRFRIGYSRAARLIDVMEVRGIVGSYQGSKPREVLADSTILEER